MNPTSLEIAATVLFAIALAHTFSVKLFQSWAARYPEGSVQENVFHLLGEIEVVFGLWAAVYVALRMFFAGDGVAYVESLNYTEPVFVFVVLSICSTRPILAVAERLIVAVSRLVPLKRPLAFYVIALTMGPLLGSFITEPAAMAVTALILYDRYYSKSLSPKLMYATLGLLFVNVSIGGTLTPYAAPPILMVAPGWGWDLGFMVSQFGWRGALACVLSTSATAFVFRREIAALPWTETKHKALPWWIPLSHLLFLALVVLSSHHMAFFVALFLFFLGLYNVTSEYQENISLREGLLVAFFLGGLVVLGPPQRWWLEPLLTRASGDALFWGTTALTAITDNAALTYLGSQVPELSESARIALVSGAVVGGGLTVIANAPNPAGYGILNPAFKNGISPLGLLAGALPPTVIASICFWLI
jgi:hypothetical protein